MPNKIDEEIARRLAALKGLKGNSLTNSEIDRRVKNLGGHEPQVPHRKRPDTTGVAPDVANLLNQVYDGIKVEERVAARDKRFNDQFAANVEARLAALKGDKSPANPTKSTAGVARPAPVKTHQQSAAAQAKAQQEAQRNAALRNAAPSRALGEKINKVSPAPAAQPRQPTSPPARPILKGVKSPVNSTTSTAKVARPNPVRPHQQSVAAQAKAQQEAQRNAALNRELSAKRNKVAPTPAAQPRQLTRAPARPIAEKSVNKPKDGHDILRAEIEKNKAKVAAWRQAHTAPASAQRSPLAASQIKSKLKDMKNEVAKNISKSDLVVTEHHTTSTTGKR
jgi:hypothetical protein